jgi:gentisate 1,2-dioxygenase
MAESRREKLAKTDHWGELLALRDRQREQMKDAIQVVRDADLPQETNRQGLMRWYLHPAIKDTVLSTMIFFEQEIPPGSRTGRVKFQGGQVMMIIEGEGYTILDGVRHPWKEGDVVNLPLRPDGIIVQHFNVSKDKPAKFVAAEPNWFECVTVDRGSGFEQIEDAPEYKKK